MSNWLLKRLTASGQIMELTLVSYPPWQIRTVWFLHTVCFYGWQQYEAHKAKRESRNDIMTKKLMPHNVMYLHAVRVVWVNRSAKPFACLIKDINL